MINQLAANPNITSTELILHSQTINETLREKSQDSRTLAALCGEIKNVGLELMQRVQNLKRQGARVIVCDDADGLQLVVKRVVKMLSESSSSLDKIASKFDNHARGYDGQLQINNQITNKSWRVFSLKTRASTCEQQSNDLLMKQKNFLQRAMPKIEEHESAIEGFKSVIGLPETP